MNSAFVISEIKDKVCLPSFCLSREEACNSCKLLTRWTQIKNLTDGVNPSVRFFVFNHRALQLKK